MAASAPPVPLEDVLAELEAVDEAEGWRGVVKLDGRMLEMMALGADDADVYRILTFFVVAHRMRFRQTGDTDHARSYCTLLEWQIPLLGNLQRFGDQGHAMCNLSHILQSLERHREGVVWSQRARDVGEAHGFFSLESKACLGLGKAAVNGGRHEEGLALLRNALVAAELTELDDSKCEREALQVLLQVLFQDRAFDEVEPLLVRFKEEAKAQSEKEGLCGDELLSLIFSARLHEVRCTQKCSVA